MRKHHPKNERIKRRYLAYLEEVDRMSVKSTDQVAASLALFEESTGYKDFAAFHIEQARKFKRQQAEYVSPETGKPLAVATIRSRLLKLKAFFKWLAGEPGYRSKFKAADASYFNPSANETRIATAKREKRAPSADQIRHVLQSMKAETDIEKRNRALIAFAFLSGARDDAIASLSVRHVDLERRRVFQDARTVRTKNRKTIESWFFPIGDDIEAIVREWIEFLINERHFGPDDPLFPSTEIAVGPSGGFQAAGLKRDHWKNAQAVRRIFREAFEGADVSYYHPHSLRHTLTGIGKRVCRTPEEFKAWSQNMAHEDVLTTLTNYGTVSSERQAEIMGRLGSAETTDTGEELSVETINRVLAHLQRKTISG